MIQIVPDGSSDEAIKRCFQRLQFQLNFELDAIRARLDAFDALNLDARITALENLLAGLVLVTDDGFTVLTDDGDTVQVFG